jgi:hypothetical protein
LLVGHIIFTGGLIGLATIQPGQSVNAVAFSCLVGIGLELHLFLLLQVSNCPRRTD